MASFISDLVKDINAGKRIASYAMNAPVVATVANVSGFGLNDNDTVALFKVPVTACVLMAIISFDKAYGASAGLCELSCAKIGAAGFGEELVKLSTVQKASNAAADPGSLYVPFHNTLLKIITDANKAEALGNDQYVYLTFKTTKSFSGAANVRGTLYATTASTAGTPLEAISY